MWQVEIDVIDIQAKRAQITAIRTDTITDEIYVYSCTAILETPSQRSAVLQLIKDKYLEYLDRQDQADSVISGLEDTAANALNSWEETL